MKTRSVAGNSHTTPHISLNAAIAGKGYDTDARLGCATPSWHQLTRKRHPGWRGHPMLDRDQPPEDHSISFHDACAAERRCGAVQTLGLGCCRLGHSKS
eukprot:15525-Eustigmatos_ZCMA.PRE.1